TRTAAVFGLLQRFLLPTVCGNPNPSPVSVGILTGNGAHFRLGAVPKMKTEKFGLKNHQ
ncbi:unnamed protein product, partial [Laminaria digitata]